MRALAAAKRDLVEARLLRAAAVVKKTRRAGHVKQHQDGAGDDGAESNGAAGGGRDGANAVRTSTKRGAGGLGQQQRWRGARVGRGRGRNHA